MVGGGSMLYHEENLALGQKLSVTITCFDIFPGGDGEKDLDEEESAQQNKQQDLGRLNSFIQRAGQVKPKYPENME